jgi:hypothetical protein
VTIEQFLACDCVGLESHALGLGCAALRRSRDPRTRCGAAVDAMEGSRLVEQWVQPAVVAACPCAVTTARARSGGHGAAGIKALRIGEEQARRESAALACRARPYRERQRSPNHACSD